MDRPPPRDLPAGLLVAAAAALAGAGALGNGFAWDDAVVIVGNPALRGDALALFSGVDAARVTELTPFYRPLTLLSFLVEERLHGLDPRWMHLLNLALHAGVAVLVHRLARAVSGDRLVALGAGLLFAVHPLGAEAVAFLSGGRNTLLATGLALLALLLHRAAAARQRLALAALAGAALLAGLLAKETALPVLAFVVAAEVGALRGGDAAARARALLRLAPHGVALALYLWLRQGALSGAGVRVRLLDGLAGRLADLAYLVPRGLLSVAWPPASSPRYFLPTDLAPLALPLALGWCAIAAALWWLLGRGASAATRFGLAWLVAFWLPVSGIVPFPGVPLADRYLSAPAIGLWLVVADQAVRLGRAHLSTRRAALAAGGAAVLLLAALGAQAFAATRVWADDVTLFTRVVERYPDQAFGHHNLGTAYLEKVGDLDAAERELLRALELAPAFPRLQTQLGYARILRGDFEGARARYRLALLVNPADAEALYNTGYASERLGDWATALEHYRRFLQVPPGDLAHLRPTAVEKVQVLPLLLPR